MRRWYLRHLFRGALLGILFWIALAFILGVLIASAETSAPRAVMLGVGRFDATQTEESECYFTIGTGATVIFHPRGEPCKVARALIGKTGTLMFVID